MGRKVTCNKCNRIDQVLKGSEYKFYLIVESEKAEKSLWLTDALHEVDFPKEGRPVRNMICEDKPKAATSKPINLTARKSFRLAQVEADVTPEDVAQNVEGIKKTMTSMAFWVTLDVLYINYCSRVA
ncbi:hypothetical protein CDAR_317741 [Caerostris darwini]|uniref:Uncharacterized protein n=1 Tax=Caerostris darwini TaxID=1538125 RepID=A0AAV4WSR3_9ARAC|nr:hypothetical protein CDAR_317741 [Caerostris darwini]